MAAAADAGAAERRIVLYTAARHALVHMLEWTYAVLLVDIGHQYGAGFFLLGALSNVFSYAFGFAALPSGLLTDRLGSQRVLYVCLGGASLAAVFVGLSPNVWVLAVALAALGLGIGLYHPAGTWGWCWRGVRGADEDPPAAPEPATAASVSEPPSTLLLWPLILVYAAFVLNGFVYSAARTFLPTHIRLKGYEDLAAVMTTVALLTGALGQYGGGSLTQRYRLERLAPIMPVMVVPARVLMGTNQGGLL